MIQINWRRHVISSWHIYHPMKLHQRWHVRNCAITERVSSIVGAEWFLKRSRGVGLLFPFCLDKKMHERVLLPNQRDKNKMVWWNEVNAENIWLRNSNLDYFFIFIYSNIITNSTTRNAVVNHLSSEVKLSFEVVVIPPRYTLRLVYRAGKFQL